MGIGAYIERRVEIEKEIPLKEGEKSIKARKIFKQFPELKIDVLWGGEFWSDGYFVSTVGAHGDADMIANYVKHQGTQQQNNYKKLHSQNQ